MVKKLTRAQQLLLDRIRLCSESGYLLYKDEKRIATILEAHGLIYIIDRGFPINSIAYPRKEE